MERSERCSENQRTSSGHLARLDPMRDDLFPGEQARIIRLLVERVTVSDAGAAPFEATGIKSDGTLGIRFTAGDNVRRDLIRKLFTGDYDIEVPKVRPGATMMAVVRRVFG